MTRIGFSGKGGLSEAEVSALITTHAGVSDVHHTPTAIASGLIVVWHGTIANIPAGWVICDGNNSTPNLLTKFVQGVATAGTDPGAVGGEATHQLTVAELAQHQHDIAAPGGSGTGSAEIQADSSNALSLYPDELVGGNSAHENEPTFYDVAFIMKT